MDLMCMTPAAIGFLITAYYIGFAVGGLFFAFPDKHGRKKSLILGLIMATISQAVMIFCTNYWMRFAMFFLSGLSQIKNSVSYVWASECTSKEYKTRAFTAINIFDAFPMVFTCFYFMFVSKNWMHLSLFFCILCFVALAAAFLCPESPRWHLVNGRSKEAIIELNKIAAMNRQPTIPANAIFIEDPSNVQAIIDGVSERRSRLASNNLGNESTDLAVFTRERVLENNDSPLLPNKGQQVAAGLNISHMGADVGTHRKVQQFDP